MDLLLFARFVLAMQLKQLSIKGKVLGPLVVVTAKVAAAAHQHLAQNILIVRGVSADEVF